MDPALKKYLAEKYPGQVPAESVQDEFSDDNYKKAMEDAESQKSGLGWSQFAAGLGDALAGRDSSNTARSFQQIRQGIDANTVGSFEKRKDAAVKDLQLKKSLEGSDPNSPKSQSFRKAIEANFPNIAKQYGDSWANVTADDQQAIFQPLQLRENIETRKETARISAADRAENRAARLDEKAAQREVKEAEKAKLSEKQVDAFTDLDNAESDLQNMLASLGQNKNWTGPIDGGVPDLMVGSDQVAFRSAVGKYKDAYRKAITGAGAGPKEIAILEKRLPSEYDEFKDFQAKANEGLSELRRRKQVMSSNLQKSGKNVSQFEAAPLEKKKNIVKTQTNQKTGEKRVIYDDGSVEIISQVAGGR